MEMVKIRIFINGAFMLTTYDTEINKKRLDNLINLLNDVTYRNKLVRIGDVILKPKTVERIIVL
ncbi:hypothetical protein PTB14_10225 [Enterococcus faecalis]|uniref:hypothetical protein n=1 Tax=Enterococcus faecalis TaxID=1351 RepID=UPI0003544553|nr:hypothetical protein [Enterococcus faecalis]EPH81427.1 hypothetical protein D924_02623 [Enterococcus faecalis 06-MB-S-10]EPH85858.1 hypothetical protein D923_03000 [Enterococcus faecalis 06-MB-S-04]EPI34376.1 hypothetical protein D349_00201 [Enterococcus faecalis UP2S-6]MDD0850785.1 hypothetical protein [Enterococcus faecalis]